MTRSCPSRNAGRRCTLPEGHAGLHRRQGLMWSDVGADPLRCPASGSSAAPAVTLPDGFPDGRALCEHCLRFVPLDPEGRLVEHDTSDPHETQAEESHRRAWFNSHGW